MQGAARRPSTRQHLDAGGVRDGCACASGRRPSAPHARTRSWQGPRGRFALDEREQPATSCHGDGRAAPQLRSRPCARLFAHAQGTASACLRARSRCRPAPCPEIAKLGEDFAGQIGPPSVARTTTRRARAWRHQQAGPSTCEAHGGLRAYPLPKRRKDHDRAHARRGQERRGRRGAEARAAPHRPSREDQPSSR